MAYRKGRDFLIYAESTTTASTFIKVGGCRELTFAATNGEIDITNKDSAGNRELLEGTYNMAVAITANGVYDDAGTVMEELQTTFTSGSFREFVCTLPDTSTKYLRCTGLITNLEYSGADGEITYNLAISSSSGFTISTTSVTLA
jgi:TP901-1 family phage major tail protein